MPLKILQADGEDSTHTGTYPLPDGREIEYAVATRINRRPYQHDHYLVMESPSGLKAVVLDGVGNAKYSDLASLWGAQAIAARELAVHGDIGPNEYLLFVESRSEEICPWMDLRKLRRRFEKIYERSKRKEIPLKKLVDGDSQALVQLVKEATEIDGTATTFVSLRLGFDFQRRTYQQGDSQVYQRTEAKPNFSIPHTVYQYLIDIGRLNEFPDYSHGRLKNRVTAGLGQSLKRTSIVNPIHQETNGSFKQGDIYAIASDGALACGERFFDEIASDMDLSCIEAIRHILEESSYSTKDNQTLFLARVLDQ